MNTPVKRRRYAVGNWKMNGTSRDLNQIARIGQAAKERNALTVLCLPSTLLDRARGHGVWLGGQDCHEHERGAHTGDVSAEMLTDSGATHVILGHSERRVLHGECNATVARKARSAWDVGLIVIICIGETEAQFRSGITLDILHAQIAGSVPPGASPANTIIAYEPVWSIGTGLTPGPRDIASIHKSIRSVLKTGLGREDFSILYGGSLTADNAAGIFALPDVDGGLVGGASLSADDFLPVMRAVSQQGECA